VSACSWAGALRETFLRLSKKDRDPTEALSPPTEVGAHNLFAGEKNSAAKLFTTGAADGEGFAGAFLRRL